MATAAITVGIGTQDPSEPLTVAGKIQSTTGGFVYPDGSTQTTSFRSIAASYLFGVNFTVKRNIPALINWFLPDTDTNAATTQASGTLNPDTGTWSVQNWKYTIPQTGLYQVDAMVSFAPLVSNISNTWCVYIYKNGAFFKGTCLNGWPYGGTGLKTFHVPIRGIFRFNAGDFIDIRATQDLTDTAYYGAPQYLTILWVGN